MVIAEIVVKAYLFAKEKHQGQTRKFCSMPYFIHPKAVAKILEQITNDKEVIAAALLHDVAEDTNTTIEEIKSQFGDRIAALVYELTNRKEERGDIPKKDYLYYKIRHMSKDALTIKLADRLHNLMFLERDRGDKDQQKFALRYMEESKYIINDLPIKNKIQSVLLDKIKAVIAYLEIMYDKEKTNGV